MSLNFYTIKENNKIFDELKKKYIVHNKGKIILGPSCIGKTTFIKSQVGKKKHWIDTDVIMSKLDLNWHFNESDPNQEELNYRICDFYLAQLKLQGFWILGSLFWDYKPDAIILPKWKEHKKLLKKREIQQKNNELNFVWNMTEKDVINQRNLMKKLAKERKIPIYKSIYKSI